MKTKQLQKNLRSYETAYDFSVPPNTYMIARIDGRNFTRLTKERHNFERPFDAKFRDLMIATTKHLMHCGFPVTYAYYQSDEISLLFDINIDTFSRKIRKYNSVLAGEASAKFSVLLGDIGVFDCRISQLPRKLDVINYFKWRSDDAYKNTLNAHCYWALRNKNHTAKQAAKIIEGKTISFKNELLFNEGINVNNLPNWQKRGVGFYWIDIKKEITTKTQQGKNKKVLKTNLELPMGSEYSKLVESLIT